jgi:hypothetical protein
LADRVLVRGRPGQPLGLEGADLGRRARRPGVLGQAPGEAQARPGALERGDRVVEAGRPQAGGDLLDLHALLGDARLELGAEVRVDGEAVARGQRPEA